MNWRRCMVLLSIATVAAAAGLTPSAAAETSSFTWLKQSYSGPLGSFEGRLETEAGLKLLYIKPTSDTDRVPSGVAQAVDSDFNLCYGGGGGAFGGGSHPGQEILVFADAKAPDQIDCVSWEDAFGTYDGSVEILKPAFPVYMNVNFGGISAKWDEPDLQYVVAAGPEGLAPTCPKSSDPTSATAPSVTVTRNAQGYLVSWTAVPGAAAYGVFTDEAVGLTGDGGYMVNDRIPARPLGEVDCHTTQLQVPDHVSADTNLDAYSARFEVMPYVGGIGTTRGVGRADCAAGYFVSARGSGENPTLGGDSYAQGLGGRGLNVYDEARRRLNLSRSQFQANAINYPAVNVVDPRVVNPEHPYYYASQRAGVAAVKGMLARIEADCPNVPIVLFGYSQGAHAVGDAFWDLGSNDKAKIASLELMADAARRPRDPSVTNWGTANSISHNAGIFGPRALFRDANPGQVHSWCSWQDKVCARLTGFKAHGSQYDCYEEWAAWNIARRLAATAAGAPELNEPTCQMY